MAETWDYEALHRYLWSLVDDRQFLEIKQSDVAKDFNVSAPMITYIMERFEQEGRVERLSKKGQRISRFRVSDPGFYTVPR